MSDFFFNIQDYVIHFILFYLFIYYFFYFTILYWFCHTSTSIRHGCTHISILNPPPTFLPIPSLWVIPMHQPQASCILHRTWTGDSFFVWYYTCFNAILPDFYNNNNNWHLLSIHSPGTVLSDTFKNFNSSDSSRDNHYYYLHITLKNKRLQRN